MKTVGQTIKYKTNSKNRKFKILELNLPFWNILFSDQYLLPRVTLKIQNIGNDIEICIFNA